MIKVVIVASKYPPEYAGAGLRIHRTYQRVRFSCPVERAVLCNSEEFFGSTDLIHEGVPVRRISSRLFPGWRGFRSPPLRRLAHAARAYHEAIATIWELQRRKPDLIHVLGSSASTSAAILWGRLRRIPLIVELVTRGASPFQPLPGLASLWRIRLDQGLLVIAIAAHLKEEMAAIGLSRNVWQRPNPVDETRFFPANPEEKATLRREFGFDLPPARLLVDIASFKPQKNQAFLIDLLDRLPPRFSLLLAGPVVQSGPWAERDRRYLEEIRRTIATRGLETRVRIIDRFVDAAPLTRMADMVLMPATGEGLGAPMLEGLASGVPVIANAGEPPFRQWIREGVNGCLAPLDPDQWSEAVLRLEGMPPRQTHAFARDITAKAATEVVDGRFQRLFESLLVQKGRGELNVEATLASAESPAAPKTAHH